MLIEYDTWTGAVAPKAPGPPPLPPVSVLLYHYTSVYPVFIFHTPNIAFFSLLSLHIHFSMQLSWLLRFFNLLRLVPHTVCCGLHPLGGTLGCIDTERTGVCVCECVLLMNN